MQRCNGLPVPEADTVVDVGAVVIKLRHAAVTDPGQIYCRALCRYLDICGSILTCSAWRGWGGQCDTCGTAEECRDPSRCQLQQGHVSRVTLYLHVTWHVMNTVLTSVVLPLVVVSYLLDGPVIVIRVLRQESCTNVHHNQAFFGEFYYMYQGLFC